MDNVIYLYQLPVQDLADERKFSRGYMELNPSTNAEFDRNTYKNYSVEKFKQTSVPKDSLIIFGRQIAQPNRSDIEAKHG